MTRAQLNIKIAPDLLARVKAHATRQGMTVTDFVATVLAKAISEENSPTLEERISKIEKHLGLGG